MLREILVWPHPVLQKKAVPVPTVTEEIRTLVRDMFETMYEADGVGLAANQIGVLQRVLVLDTSSGQEGTRRVAMINPEITVLNGVQVYNEGCLSFPGESEDVERAATVTVRFLDEDGQPQTLDAEGLLAVAIQHEIDHLNGIVFVDHLSSLKRGMIDKRMKRAQASKDRRASP